MKRLGFLAAGLTLLMLGAEPPLLERLKDAPILPGAPAIRYNASILEAHDSNNKPLLKIVGQPEYNPNLHVISWLLELQTDIGFEEKRAIDQSWYATGFSKGPGAHFFDKDGMVIYLREMKLLGKLFDGKKGDRIRMLLEIDKLPDGRFDFQNAAYMEIRRPYP
jgi:hypothetical protein